MTIIIKTPQPDTEWRLVLVPASMSIHESLARDATPDDLARAGYVPGGVVPWERLAAEAGAERDKWQARAEKAERERDEARRDLVECRADVRQAERWNGHAELERTNATLRAELARLLDLLGATPADSVLDMFPGTGSMGRAIAHRHSVVACTQGTFALEAP